MLAVIVAYVGVLEAHQRTTLPALISGLYPRRFEDGEVTQHKLARFHSFIAHKHVAPPLRKSTRPERKIRT